LQSLGYVAGSHVKEDFSFDQSLEDPKDLIEFHNQGRDIAHLLLEKKFSDARVVVERLLKQRPAFGLYEMGTEIALKQKDFESAIRYGEQALELASGSGNFHLKLNLHLGLAYAQTRRDEEAAKHFQLLLKFFPKDQRAFVANRVLVHNQLASIRVRQKQFDRAIAQFQGSLKLNPKQSEILNAFAWTLVSCPDQSLRNPSQAMALAQQACDLTQGKQPLYLNTLAIAHASLHHYSEAVNLCEKAVALAQAKNDQKLVARLQKQLFQFRKALTEQR
jgi:tetratricopeptide (TPR) repeat protein